MNGLSEKTISQLHRVFTCCKEIDQVLIYGSRAKGDFRPGSDIDLTFRGSNLTHNLMLGIGNQIDDLLLSYKVDLSLYATLSPDIKDHIQRVGQSFYQRVAQHHELVSLIPISLIFVST